MENDRATGIRLSNGNKYRGDYIISAADGYSTIYGMLEGKYLTEPIEKYYGGAEDSSPFGFFVFLGLDGELPEAPHSLTLLLDEPIDLGGMTQDSLHVVTFDAETGLVPEGKSIVKVELQAKYSYWKERRDADLKAYGEEKNRLANEIIDRIEPRFPGIKGKIEIMNTATPPTAERFTGCRYGWQAGPPKENIEEIQRKGLSKTLPGLSGFRHAGQWSGAALGVSTVAISGRNTIKDLCKENGKRFVTSG